MMSTTINEINQYRLPTTGEKVAIQGLVSASHLNGKTGTVFKYEKETHRYGVRIADAKSSTKKKKSISVLSKNILLQEDSKKTEWDNRLVHVFVPCHISGNNVSNNRRLEQFRQCVRSLYVQAERCRILIGVSAENDDMRQNIVDILRTVTTLPTPPLGHHQWFMLLSPNTRSQFQHFQTLMPISMTLNPSAWIMFLDNDDMYHPLRVKWFQQVARKCKDNMVVDGFYSGGKLLIDDVKVRAKFGDNEIPHLEMFLEFDDSLNDAVDVAATADENNEKDVMEFFDYCVRTRVLSRFLSLTPSGILQNQFCDARFAECLNRLYFIERHHPEQEWLLLHYRIRHWDRHQLFLQRDLSSRKSATMAIQVSEADKALSEITGLDAALIAYCRRDIEESAIQMVERDDEGLEHRRLMLIPRMDESQGHQVGSRLWEEVCNNLSSCFSADMAEKNRQWCAAGKKRVYDLKADTDLGNHF